MKIRAGFVSNSSSSSFIVNREKQKWVPHPSGEKNRVEIAYDIILTEEQEQDLIGFGFQKDKCYDNTSYNLEISCNQDCVMKFLIDHKIPFVACCHYGHEHYFWDGKSDNLIYLRNFGEEYAMYGDTKYCNAEKLFNEKAGEYVPVTRMTDCDISECDSKRVCDIMKIRNGFVSNSSSSSFVLKKSDLKPFQICAIKYHLEFGELFGIEHHMNEYDRWTIRGLSNPKNNNISLSTSMTNFNMREFLHKIGVPDDKVPEEEDWDWK